ncbi:MAG: hypothetical protein D6814_06180 [Calditrichaeota bacterium]|nr:MAG: hypothetical protein D6814_06180 [Calditrichota bacterium]
MNMIEALQDPELEKHKQKIYGVAVAIVTGIGEEEKLGQVQVQFPWLSDEDESLWARILTPLAGYGRGFYHLPDIGDEVLVAFEFGDINRPIVLGALWNRSQVPPETEDGKLTIQNTGKIVIESEDQIIIKGTAIDFQKA